MSNRSVSKSFEEQSGDGGSPKFIDFKKVFLNATSKGYEAAVIDSMQKRSVYQCLFENPQLLRMDNVFIQREVSERFLKLIDDSEGFRMAYKTEVCFIRQIGRVIPEQRIERLSFMASEYIKAAEGKTLSQIQTKENLINEARSTASIFRVFGLDDSVVIQKFSQNPILEKNGVTQKVFDLISFDRKIGRDARDRAKAEHASKKAIGR